MTKKQKLIIYVALPLMAVLALGTYFNRDTMHVTNIDRNVAEQNNVSRELTPEQMIEKVTRNIGVVSVEKMENDRIYLDYVDFMQGEIETMTKEANRLFAIASTSNEKLNKATKAYQDLRDLLRF